MTSPRSIRFSDAVLVRLDRYVHAHPGSSSSSVANMFIDESLRAYEHPGVVFRPGPTGRRAALAGGPDVWEIVSALHDIRAEQPALAGDDLAAELATVTGIGRPDVSTALRYYAEYPDEIDDRITANRAVADQEERLWHAEQRLLSRQDA